MSQRSTFDRAMGLGSVDILGAPAAPGENSNAAVQEYGSRVYRNCYQIDVGFASAAPVAAGASVQIAVRVSCPFKPRRMQIPSDIAFDFTIDGMQLMDKNFIEGPVPCAQHTEVSTVNMQRELDIGTIDTQDALLLTFTNRGAAPLTLRGSFFGTRLST